MKQSRAKEVAQPATVKGELRAETLFPQVWTRKERPTFVVYNLLISGAIRA
jgi:hypothetical protein